MYKVVIDAIIHLDEIVLGQSVYQMKAEALANDDDRMEQRILEHFPEEWRENIVVRLESVDVYSEDDE